MSSPTRSSATASPFARPTRVRYREGGVYSLRMPVFLFELEAVWNGPQLSSVAGAYVNCWVARDTLEDADAVAMSLIDSDGWLVVQRISAKAVSRDDFDPDSPGLAHFDQCMIDGEVAVFHTFPQNDDGDCDGE
jgi:hypothetical protein